MCLASGPSRHCGDWEAVELPSQLVQEQSEKKPTTVRSRGHRDGERLLYRNEGENLNEGLTQYLTEDKLSAEELSMAQAMRIYPFATEAAASLSDILGSASIREDFYEGTSHIRDALDETLGQGTFQRFCSCLDQASESPESDQRREAMREANKILNTLAARKAAEKQNKEA